MCFLIGAKRSKSQRKRDHLDETNEHATSYNIMPEARLPFFPLVHFPRRRFLFFFFLLTRKHQGDEEHETPPSPTTFATLYHRLDTGDEAREADLALCVCLAETLD